MTFDEAIKKNSNLYYVLTKNPANHSEKKLHSFITKLKAVDFFFDLLDTSERELDPRIELDKDYDPRNYRE